MYHKCKKNEHSHEPDERKAERQQFKCNAKRKASEDATSRPSKSIRKQLQTMSETNLHQDDIKMCQKQFIVNAEKDAQPYQN
jgi:hypothetical protein